MSVAVFGSPGKNKAEYTRASEEAARRSRGCCPNEKTRKSGAVLASRCRLAADPRTFDMAGWTGTTAQRQHGDPGGATDLGTRTGVLDAYREAAKLDERMRQD
jgi:hypothetical protein